MSFRQHRPWKRWELLLAAIVARTMHCRRQSDRCSRLSEENWQSTGFARTVCEDTTHRTPCGLPSSFLTAWSNNVQPCEVSKKTSIFSFRWKSAPEAMTACWMCFVMYFGGKTRLCVCSSCCGIDRVMTKSTMKPSSLQNKCSTTRETLA